MSDNGNVKRGDLITQTEIKVLLVCLLGVVVLVGLILWSFHVYNDTRRRVESPPCAHEEMLGYPRPQVLRTPDRQSIRVYYRECKDCGYYDVVRTEDPLK